jgi:uncharacterized protein YkwD
MLGSMKILMPLLYSVCFAVFFLTGCKTGTLPPLLDEQKPTIVVPSAGAIAANPKTTHSAIVQKLLGQINRERGKRGLAPLTADQKLTAAAQRHAEEQARFNHLDHKSINGDSVSDRVSKAGFNWSFVAENLAAGRETTEATIQDWIKSPGHNKNLFTKQASHFGAAYIYVPRKTAQDLGHFWVLVVAKPLE